MAIGKVGKNGTLNENGAFYSVQDVNTLLENVGGGADLPEPTVADAGSVVVVGDDGNYALGDVESVLIVNSTLDDGNYILDKTAQEIMTAFNNGNTVIIKTEQIDGENTYIQNNVVISILEAKEEGVYSGILTIALSSNAFGELTTYVYNCENPSEYPILEN